MDQTPATVTAGAVRAELARRRITGRKLAADLGWSKTTTARRLNGEYPLTVDELVAVAHYLDLPVTALLPADARGAA